MPLNPEVRDRLHEFLKEAKDGEGLVRVVENTLKYLKSKHLLTSMKLDSNLVGIHPVTETVTGSIRKTSETLSTAYAMSAMSRLEYMLLEWRSKGHGSVIGTASCSGLPTDSLAPWKWKR